MQLANLGNTGAINITQHPASTKKPRLNYDKMIEKVQKQQNGDAKPEKVTIFEAAKPHHKYNTKTIAMRKMYSEINRK